MRAQIRRRISRRLIRVSIVCLQDFVQNLNKSEKYHPTPLILEIDFLLVTVDKSIRLSWVKEDIFHPTQIIQETLDIIDIKFN